jgi:stearoyl-CoA desaturase (Delta-9 desaturase)
MYKHRNKFMSFWGHINWTNTLFLTLTPLIGIIGMITLCHFNGSTLILTFIFSGITGLAITAGYHRLFAHKSYKTLGGVRLFLLLFAAAAFEGSALEWSTDHRRHHRHTDTDLDPYNIKRGFWYAHIGWLFLLDPSKRDYSNVKDLSTDPLIRLQHRFFIPLAILIGFLLPMGIASLWGDPWGGLFIAGALRIAFNQQMTFCINSVCHVFGKHTFEQQSGRDNWLTALFTFGEGFHNFHHQFAMDYRNGTRFFHFDPTKWLIRGMAYLKLAKDLQKVNIEQIIRYRIHSDEGSIFKKTAQHSESFMSHIEHFVQPLRDRILHTAQQLHQLEKDYLALKNKKMEYLKGKMSDYHTHLNEQRKRLKNTRWELKNSLLLWRKLIQEQSSAI